MLPLLVLGIFWSAYGVLGLFGIQFIGWKFRGYPWTKTYIRNCGITYILMGVAVLIQYFIFRHSEPSLQYFGCFLILGSPGMVFSWMNDQKYKQLLKNQDDAQEVAKENEVERE